jgi:hypothetical protein
MDIWTKEQEAAKLEERFRAVKNRKKFAADNAIPGGDTQIYQHLHAIRPISQDAAVAYARAFGCSLEDISPRIAQEVAFRAAMIGNKNAIPLPVVQARGAMPKGWENLNGFQRELVESFIEWIAERSSTSFGGNTKSRTPKDDPQGD